MRMGKSILEAASLVGGLLLLLAGLGSSQSPTGSAMIAGAILIGSAIISSALTHSNKNRS